MSTANGRQWELRSELRVWANSMDMVLRRAPGSSLREWLGDREVEALDLDEIESLCRVALAQYKVLVAHYDVRGGDSARRDQTRDFKRQSRNQPIMYHDVREPDERSG